MWDMECQTVDALEGRSISHYAIGSLIGSGGMGRVYFARDERLRRDVAIKVIDRGAAQRGGSPGGLMWEARMLSRLSHANVASVYDLVSHGDTEFLVMEFVPGPTVRQLLSAGPLPLPEVLRLGVQLAHGLAAVHGAGVIHRDIKPENLKVTATGDLKLIDFGVATPLAGLEIDGPTRTPSQEGVAGTLHYMSPEQLLGGEADERTDIYSAGAVVYEMAAGCPAFAQRQMARLIEAILHETPRDLRDVNPAIPGRLADLVARTLGKRPEARPRTAASLASLLESTRRRSRSEVLAGGMTAWLATLLG